MANLTLILTAAGQRAIVHQSDLFSEHLDLYRDLLQDPPAEAHGIEVWRDKQGRVKNVFVTPGSKARSLSSALSSFAKILEDRVAAVEKARKADQKLADKAKAPPAEEEAPKPSKGK